MQFKIGDIVKFSKIGKEIFKGNPIDGNYKIYEINLKDQYPYKFKYDGFTEGFASVDDDEIELVAGQLSLPFKGV